jgi:hypothetical protein
VLGVVPPDWSKAVRPNDGRKLQRDGAGHKLSGDIRGVHNTPDELNVSGQF